MNEGDEQLDRVLRRVPSSEGGGACADDGDLLAYQKGTLAPEKVEPLELHLAACGECRTLLLELSRPLALPARTRAEVAFSGRTAGGRRGPWLGALGLAMAAALALFALMPRTLPPLEYRLEGPLGGIKGDRGEGPASLTFAPNGTLRFLLRPERGGASDARPYVLRIEADDRLVDVTGTEWLVTDDGGVRWSAPVQRVVAGPGRTRLAVVLSRSLPTGRWDPRNLTTAQAADPTAQWWFNEIEVLEEPKKEDDR